jgi:hypothetical protein
MSITKLSTIKINKTKNSACNGRVFGVDPAVFESASPLVKGVVLPHELRAQAHEAIIKQKKPSIQGLHLLTSGFARNSYEHRLYMPIILS